MLWATRQLNVDKEFYIRELFEAQCAALGRPRDMMLIAVDEEARARRVFVGVPDAELLNAYHGFEPCLRRELPMALTLIAGHQDVFQAMFQAGGSTRLHSSSRVCALASRVRSIISN